MDDPIWQYHISSIKVWTVVQADRAGNVTLWVEPGWYRREKSSDGIISLVPMRGWKLRRHRALWGFSKLVDAR